MNTEGELNKVFLSEEESEKEVDSPEKLVNLAENIFNEERKKLEGKIDTSRKNSFYATMLVLVSAWASVEQFNPEMAKGTAQAFDYFGASPEISAIFNMGLIAFEGERRIRWEQKIRSLISSITLKSNVSGSQ